MREHLETRDGKRIMVDCGACGGCGEDGPGGFACGTCGGTGYFVYDKPKRDYEAAGRRAFEAGKPLAANPYRYGWPSHGWMLGWIDASDDAKKVPASQRLDLLMPNRQLSARQPARVDVRLSARLGRWREAEA